MNTGTDSTMGPGLLDLLLKLLDLYVQQIQLPAFLTSPWTRCCGILGMGLLGYLFINWKFGSRTGKGEGTFEPLEPTLLFNASVTALCLRSRAFLGSLLLWGDNLRSGFGALGGHFFQCWLSLFRVTRVGLFRRISIHQRPIFIFQLVPPHFHRPSFWPDPFCRWACVPQRSNHVEKVFDPLILSSDDQWY